MDKAEQMLRNHGMRVTPTRKWVIDQYRNENQALSHADLESKANKEIDRVTLYRTLQGFEDSGIIHKVLDDSGALKYNLCKHDCNSDGHSDEHAHFQCNTCGKTTCLEAVPIADPTLPRGYIPSSTYVLVKGTCAHCYDQA